jgi:superfamily II DNA or RNA helicase
VSPDDLVVRIEARLAELEAERSRLESELKALRPTLVPGYGSQRPAVTARSSSAEKMQFFRRLFAGRPDVVARRWENRKTGKSGYAPACANEWVKGLCAKPQVKCGECSNQAFIPLSDALLMKHLRGGGYGGSDDVVIGVYPLLTDDRCWFVAADFDGEHWSADARAYLDACREQGVPAALERSRSGNGGHVWIFFANPVPARDARRLGALLLTRAMERRAEIRFSSYDRLFPSQDIMPTGGFGNLIALPLAHRPRALGNSVFVDDDLRPYDDQWAFLSSLARMSAEALSALVDDAEAHGSLLGVRLPIDDEAAREPWLLPPSRRLPERQPPISGNLPAQVRVVLADEVYIERSGLPASVVAQLVRLAAFQNPEFYRAQAMRLPTYGKPRIISCANLDRVHVALPRGCLDEALELLDAHRIKADLQDRRHPGTPLDIAFVGTLRDEQIAALADLERHDFGTLAATTAFGKTVIAAALIGRRACNTLVLVHRRELLEQWVQRLRTFLTVDEKAIGTIVGGRRKPTGRIDVGLIQSLVRKGEVADIVGEYGHLVVDECHHLSAASFELVARRSKARYVLGLSATIARKDGHHPIIFMQCGPVRHRVDARSQAARRSFAHTVRERKTAFQLPVTLSSRPFSMPAIYAALGADGDRNTQIIDDVLAALEAGRSPIVLTERRDHLEHLRAAFTGATRNLVVLSGGMKASARSAAREALRACEHEERLILATGRYLGEGFDDARLDTLFLAMPISWKGTLAQYVGRLHRDHHGKKEVLVYDYVDVAVPVLARMAAKRHAGYHALGYVVH